MRWLAPVPRGPAVAGGDAPTLGGEAGLAAWALIGALVAFVAGAALWALGSHSQNMHQSSAGRRAVVTSIGAAVLIGAAPSVVNFFFHAGGSVK